MSYASSRNFEKKSSSKRKMDDENGYGYENRKKQKNFKS